MGYDQSAKTDYGKEQMSLVPTKIVHAIAKVRTWAVSHKYKDPDSWKKVETVRYRDALLRHIYAYLEDPRGVDYESGLPHLFHAATNIAFLLELEGDPMTCDRCTVKEANVYWCGWHDRICNYYGEGKDVGKNERGTLLRSESQRVDSEERRVLP